MTVAARGATGGVLGKVTAEEAIEGGEHTVVISYRSVKIAAILQAGADIASTVELKSNLLLAHQGVTPLGLGFRVSKLEALQMGIETENNHPIVKPYAIGRDIVRKWEDKFIIDFFPLSESEAQNRYPSLFQHVYTTVRPERLAKKANNKDTLAYWERWWQFAKPRACL